MSPYVAHNMPWLWGTECEIFTGFEARDPQLCRGPQTLNLSLLTFGVV